MRKRSLSLAFIFSLVFCLVACGKKGPLQLPLAVTPQAATDITLVQRGAKVVLRWSNPTSTIDGKPIKAVSEVEVWMTEEKKAEGNRARLTLQEFEEKAKLVATLGKGTLPPAPEKPEKAGSLMYVYALGPQQIGHSVLTYSLRVRDEKRRLSPFSEPLSLEVKILPLPPAKVRASIFEDRVEIRWDAPAKNIDGSSLTQAAGYNIYRAENNEPPSILSSSPVKEAEFQDKNFSFGRTYRYAVRTTDAATSPYSESDDSEVAEVLAKDVFPPAAPSGLTVITGVGYIVLSWEANKEADLAGYKVWRRELGQQEFSLLESVGLAENSYTDTTVEKNKGYVYAISALDSAGNESQRSASASAAIRGKP